MFLQLFGEFGVVEEDLQLFGEFGFVEEDFGFCRG